MPNKPKRKTRRKSDAIPAAPERLTCSPSVWKPFTQEQLDAFRNAQPAPVPIPLTVESGLLTLIAASTGKLESSPDEAFRLAIGRWKEAVRFWDERKLWLSVGWQGVIGLSINKTLRFEPESDAGKDSSRDDELRRYLNFAHEKRAIKDDEYPSRRNVEKHLEKIAREILEQAREAEKRRGIPEDKRTPLQSWKELYLVRKAKSGRSGHVAIYAIPAPAAIELAARLSPEVYAENKRSRKTADVEGALKTAHTAANDALCRFFWPE